MSTSLLDERRLSEALVAAQGAIGLSDPNPRVGCVIGYEDGRVLGLGNTQQAGGPHAEVMALRALSQAGLDARDATAWVTLEPCSHHGRTPPCCDALIEAGLRRVVIAVQDPHVKVAGRGIERLRAAGIQVDLQPADSPLALAARELNVGFFSRHERGRPWVRLKSAISLDGRVALENGQSQWITSPEARADGHQWRKRAAALLTGVGTVLKDDPRLDVREVETHTQPLRVVLDPSLRTSPTARILQAPGRLLLLTLMPLGTTWLALEAAGAEVKAMRAANGRLDLNEVLAELAAREVNEVHVEAGPTLSGAFISASLVDELLFYIAPTLLGPGLGPVSWPPLSSLASAQRLRWSDCVAVGPDLRIRALFAEPCPQRVSEHLTP